MNKPVDRRCVRRAQPCAILTRQSGRFSRALALLVCTRDTTEVSGEDLAGNEDAAKFLHAGARASIPRHLSAVVALFSLVEQAVAAGPAARAGI